MCKKYVVVGRNGVGEAYGFGVVDSLHKAKILAGKNVQYVGFNWVTPDIYDADDCIEVEDEWFGKMIVPKDFIEPLMKKVGKKWMTMDEIRTRI